MKALLLTATLVLSFQAAEARSILTFKPALKCESYSQTKRVATVDVHLAQDGQARLLINLKSEDLKLDAFGKRILPPPMSAGTPVRYVGIDRETNIEAELSVGLRPMKVGKTTGRAATLVLKNRSELPLICTASAK